MNQHERRTHQLSRRQLLRYSGISAAAVAGSGFLAGCGGDGGGGLAPGAPEAAEALRGPVES